MSAIAIGCIAIPNTVTFLNRIEILRTPRAGFALWLYHRFNLSDRDIEDLMSERGIAVSYESI